MTGFASNAGDSIAAPRDLATLWIGGELGPIERLCLCSFRDVGHRITLYSFGPLDGVPEGVVTEDARLVYDPGWIYIHRRTGSPAPHADLFRLELMRRTSFVWVDLDVLAVAPLVTSAPHLFGYETDKTIGNSVLRLPPESPALKLAQAEAEALLFGQHFDAGPEVPGMGLCTRQIDLPFTAFGPALLTRALTVSGEIAHAHERRDFYPIGPAEVRLLFRSEARLRREFSTDTVAIHLWGTRLRKVMDARRDELAGHGFLAQLFRQHGLSDAVLGKTDEVPV